jgi:hypothetical protein
MIINNHYIFLIYVLVIYILLIKTFKNHRNMFRQINDNFELIIFNHQIRYLYILFIFHI